MGVKKWDFIPWRETSLEDIVPRVIAIDAPNYLIRRTMVFEYKGKKSDDRIPTGHIHVVMGFVRQALRMNLLPIFIFDGPPESLKRPTNPELVRDAHSLYTQFRSNNDIYDTSIASTLNASNALKWYFSVNHITELCSALGIPVLTAPSEAEMFAAVLCKEGIAGTVLSNDVDALLFGSPHVTRTIVMTKDNIERCTLQDLEESIGLDLEGLRDLAVVSGCDFHKGVKGIGPRKGTVLLQRHGSLEGILKAKGFTVSEREEFIRAREVFDEPNYITTKGLQRKLSPPIVSRVSELLTPVMGKERMEKYTREAVQLWKSFGKEQTTMEQWI